MLDLSRPFHQGQMSHRACHGSRCEGSPGNRPPLLAWSRQVQFGRQSRWTASSRRESLSFGVAYLNLPIRTIGLPGWFRIGPTTAGGPVITFQPVPEEKAGKTRIHLDLWVDALDLTIALVRDLSGNDTGEAHLYDEGTVVVMSDVEGNEFCLVGPPRAK